MVKNKSGRLHNKGRYHNGQCNVMFFCMKGLSIQTNKRVETSASLCKGPIVYYYLLPYARVMVIFTFPFYFLLWQASCGEERSRHICPVEYRQHELLLLTLDKEDNLMVHVCLYSHRSHIVIDPLTCGSCPLPLLAKIPH